MRNFSRHLFVLMLALVCVGLIGCKMSNSNSSTSSNSNDKPKNSNSANISSTTTTAAPSNSTIAAPDIGGKYNVTGTNPNGSEYRGTLEIIARGDVYQFRWNAGTQYDGVAIQNGDVVAVSFANGSDGKGCGVIDYDIQGDGTLNGKWGYWGVNQAGKETATRTSGSSLEGDYDASGKNPDGKDYQTKLTVEPAGNLYRFAWSNNTDGVGIKRGNNVAVGIGGNRCGFVTYQVQANGTLDGVWGGGGSDKTGTEKAVKQ